jgi:hypothetical protein
MRNLPIAGLAGAWRRQQLDVPKHGITQSYRSDRNHQYLRIVHGCRSDGPRAMQGKQDLSRCGISAPATTAVFAIGTVGGHHLPAAGIEIG